MKCVRGSSWDKHTQCSEMSQLCPGGMGCEGSVAQPPLAETFPLTRQSLSMKTNLRGSRCVPCPSGMFPPCRQSGAGTGQESRDSRGDAGSLPLPIPWVLLEMLSSQSSSWGGTAHRHCWGAQLCCGVSLSLCISPGIAPLPPTGRTLLGLCLSVLSLLQPPNPPFLCCCTGPALSVWMGWGNSALHWSVNMVGA